MALFRIPSALTHVLLALLAFVFVLVPTADAAVCAPEPIAVEACVDCAIVVSGSEQPDREGGHEQHGLCQHGHCHHAQVGLENDDVASAPYDASSGEQFGLIASSMSSRATDGLKRPPRA